MIFRCTILAIVLSCVPVPVRSAPPTPLTRIADIRRLSREEAVKGLPVRVSGVCIPVSDSVRQYHFALWNEGECIWVSIRGTKLRGLPLRAPIAPEDIFRGAHLEIEGITDSAAYAPSIALLSIRRVGVLPVPSPNHLSVDRLLSGSEDCQWIELEGIVQAALPKGGLLMIVDGSFCRLDGVERDAEQLIDARIRVRGLFTPDVNYRSEPARLRVMVYDGKTDIDVIEPPPADPFLSPHIPLNRLMPFTLGSSFFHRKVVTGTVIFAVPGHYFYLQEGATGLRVESTSADVRIGQRVDVAGFIDTSYTFASLKGGVVRVVGTALVPRPEPVTTGQLLDPANSSDWGKAASTDFGGRMVKLYGSIQRLDWQADRVPATVWVQSGGMCIAAHFANAMPLSSRQAEQLAPGSGVELTGICEYEFPPNGGFAAEHVVPSGFHLLLAGTDQVRVLHPPSWWTPVRLTIALGGVAATLVVMSSWTAMLRREVARKTRLIEEKGRTEAVNRERERIAGDLHDEMGSNLAQIALLSEQGHLDRVIAGSRELAGQLDAVIWALNPVNNTLDHFVRYLTHYAQDVLCLAGIGLRLAMPDTLPHVSLSAEQRHQLILAAREVLHNVIKHAKATRVYLRMRLELRDAILEIEDNGIGLPPSLLPEPGHDGLENIRNRMTRIHGSSEFCTGAGGCGTLVRFTFPLPVEANQKEKK